MKASFGVPECRQNGWAEKLSSFGSAFGLGLALLVIPDLIAWYQTATGGRHVLAIEVIGTLFDAIVIVVIFSLNLRRRHAESALRAANAALVRANEFKLELLGIAAHDLKSPLGAIRMMGELLQDPAANEAAVIEAGELISSVSNEMLTLVRDLLETSAIESDQIHYEPARVDLELLTHEAVTGVRGDAERKQLHVALDVPGPVPATLDPSRLRQVLGNLLTNAVKFSPPGGQIRVRLEAGDTAAHFSISDDGPGLAPEDIPRLFRRFQRLSARPTGGEKSTGLGLWIARQIVQLQRGRIWAESKGPGCGSTFHVELPLYCVAPSTVVSANENDEDALVPRRG